MADKELELGAKRIKRKFLFLPETLRGKTRWLRSATVEEELACFT
jgi:hypothetical protein